MFELAIGEQKQCTIGVSDQSGVLNLSLCNNIICYLIQGGQTIATWSLTGATIAVGSDTSTFLFTPLTTQTAILKPTNAQFAYELHYSSGAVLKGSTSTFKTPIFQDGQ